MLTTHTHEHAHGAPHGHGHGPGHGHGHHGPEHHHAHPPAGEHPPEGGPVILDIGGAIGALLVYLDDHLIGQELFAFPADGPNTHTGIWPRALGPGQVTVAVFPELVEGPWRLALLDGTPAGDVVIRGGHAAELDLRGRSL